LILTIFAFTGCLYQLKYIDLKDEYDDKWEEIRNDENNTKKNTDKKRNDEHININYDNI
jgi:hypothetical protein